jgi:hypothetical protein
MSISVSKDRRHIYKERERERASFDDVNRLKVTGGLRSYRVRERQILVINVFKSSLLHRFLLKNGLIK